MGQATAKQQGFGARLRELLDGDVAAAIRHFRDPEMAHFSGRRFDSVGPSETDPNCFEAADLIAVSTLSMPIGVSDQLNGGIRRHSVEWIHSNGSLIREFLERVPNVGMEDLDSEGFEAVLGDSGPATQLYNLMRRDASEGGAWMGVTATSKLLARKRPALIPIRDRVMATSLSAGKDWWRPWWEALQLSDVRERIEEVRSFANAGDLSLLRTADIAIWMRQRGLDNDRCEQAKAIRERLPAV